MFFGFGMLGLGGSLAMGAPPGISFRAVGTELLATLLWPIFFFWQFFPVVATAFTEKVDSSNLLRFPLTFPSYFLIRIAYGSLDPATVVASLWLLGMAIGIAVVEFPVFSARAAGSASCLRHLTFCCPRCFSPGWSAGWRAGEAGKSWDLFSCS